MPLVSPVTKMGELVPLAVMPPQSAVWLIKTPLPDAPGTNEILALESPATATTLVGADGAAYMGTACMVFDKADQLLTPTLLTVKTLQLYVTPCSKSGTVIGDAVPKAVLLPHFAM